MRLKLLRYFVGSSNAGPAGLGDTTGGVDDGAAPASVSAPSHTRGNKNKMRRTLRHPG